MEGNFGAGTHRTIADQRQPGRSGGYSGVRFAAEAQVVARFGRLDFAHNNAGIGVHALLADTEDEDFDRVVAVNLRGTFLGMKHQIRQMLRSGGGAIEYANDGIRVNAVCPDAIMTPLMTSVPHERQQEILRPHALRRFGEPKEVASLVVWLCSDEASFVTGVAMPVDAGSVAGR